MNKLKLKGHYTVTCHRKDGSLKWRQDTANTVVNLALNFALDVVLGSAPKAGAWYIGLMSASPTVAPTDTISSHPGWTEVLLYSETVRQSLIVAAASGQSVSNTASLARFTVNADGTSIGGAFLASNGVKGGVAGLLFSAAAFSGGNQSADNGETVSITYTLASSDQ